MSAQDIYHEDLAYIHIDGYAFHWKGAADAVLALLQKHGIHDGLVVDLGCGGGQWLDRLASAGYATCGVDASSSMIRAARKHAPRATLLLGSMADVQLPHCDAVTSLGEPINYLDGKRSIQRTFRHVYAALRPGGIFVFDAVRPAPTGIARRTAARVGNSWACVAEIEEDGARNLLVRQITSFRKVGKHYRRREEVHRLKVYRPKEMLQWLRQIGFRVRTCRAYGDYVLRHRQIVFVARK